MLSFKVLSLCYPSIIPLFSLCYPCVIPFIYVLFLCYPSVIHVLILCYPYVISFLSLYHSCVISLLYLCSNSRQLLSCQEQSRYLTAGGSRVVLRPRRTQHYSEVKSPAYTRGTPVPGSHWHRD